MKKIGPLLVLSAGILWGMIGLFVRKLNLFGFSSMDIVALRGITTSLLLFIFLLVLDKKKLVIKIKDLWCFIGTGIFSIVFFNYCYFKAITLTSLSVAAILLYTAPAIVMVLSAILFREKITKMKLLSLLLTFVGCVFVTGIVSGIISGFGANAGFGAGGTNYISFYGILVGFGAGLGYALYSIFSRYALERGYHSLTISFYTFLFAMIGTAPFVDYSVIGTICRADFGIVGFVLLFGLLSTVLPYIAYTRGLEDMENGKASIIASIEPVTATLLGVIVYQEKLSFFEIAGVLLVLGAIVLSSKDKN